jgi:hypothetical protein
MSHAPGLFYPYPRRAAAYRRSLGRPNPATPWAWVLPHNRRVNVRWNLLAAQPVRDIGMGPAQALKPTQRALVGLRLPLPDSQGKEASRPADRNVVVDPV